MGAAYGPGLLPLITTSPYLPAPLDEQAQIDLLFEFAGLELMPLFHEVIGGVVYRVLSQGGERKIIPIPDKINRRVQQDIIRLSGPIDPALLDWLEAPLLIPGLPGRRPKRLGFSRQPDLTACNLQSDRNTLAWLLQEAEENANAQHPKGYTAALGNRLGFETVITAYRQLLDCLDYCDRFKFIFRLDR
jgi:hypothetical protein